MNKQIGLYFLVAWLGCALMTPAWSRTIMASETTIKGQVQTWVNLESINDVGLETTAVVTLNGQTIAQEEKVLWIDIAWGRPSKLPSSLLLFEIYQPYPALCESLYRLFDAEKADPPYVTERFGNCHAEPVVHEKGDELIFYFPRFNNNPEVAYRYTTQSGLQKVSVTPEMRVRQK